MEKAVQITKPRGGYLDALLESSPYAVIAIDGKGIITFVNKVTSDLLGYETREIVGKSISNFYETEKHARETNRKLYLSGGVIRDHESVVKTKSGKLVPVRISASHLRDSSGNYVGGVGFFETYRPWKAAEAKLKEVCQDLEAEIEEWRDLGSPVFELITGFSLAIVTGRLDGPRFERVRRKVIEHIRNRKTRVVIFDLAAALGGGEEVARQLLKTVRTVELIGARCILVGIDTEIAHPLEIQAGDIKLLQTFTTLQSAMEVALDYLGYEVVKK